MSSSPATFYERVDKAIGSPALQAAVRNATFRMSSGRDAAVAAFPEMDVVRDHARAVRAHTIARLDHYLREFETNIKVNSYLLTQISFKYLYSEEPASLWLIPDFYKKIDVAMIQQAARMYLDSAHHVQVTLMPEKR